MVTRLKKRLSKAAEIEFMILWKINGPICVAVWLQNRLKMDVDSECSRSYGSSINQELQCFEAKTCEIGMRCWHCETAFFSDAIYQFI